jgi:hypothetical protein
VLLGPEERRSQLADLSDIENALVSLITTAIYPNGTSAPSAIIAPSFAAPLNCRVISGWPIPGQIDADVAAGVPAGSAPVVNISVFPQPGMEKNTTRYPRKWETITKPPSSMTMTVSGLVITIAGTATVGHFLTIHLGNNPFSVAAGPNDTIFTVATNFGTIMRAAGIPVTVSATTIAVPAIYGGRIVLRSGAPGLVARELDRMMRRFIITVWAPNNSARVAVARVIRPALSRVDFLPLPDGYVVELKFDSEADVDRTGKASVACRDLLWWAEYPTTESAVAFPMTTFVSETGDVATNPTFGPLPLSGPSIPYPAIS